MGILSRLRRRKKSWGAQAAGLFAVVWLNMALQPCVMALEADQHDCPHCPPEIARHHDGHDMASMQVSCATAVDCSDIDDFVWDGRQPETKLEQPQAKLLALLPRAVAPPASESLGGPRHSPATDHLPGASPPRHVLFCVYLD